MKHERQRKEQEELHQREKLQNVAKAEKYAKFVKEMHWPKISKLKRQEMDAIKQSLDVSRSLNRSSQSQMIKKRVTSNRSEKRYLNKRNNEYLSGSEPTFTNLQRFKREANNSYTVLKPPKHQWKENKMIPKPQPKKEPVVVDYLMERRKVREKYDSDGNPRSRSKNPYLDLKNPSTGRHDSNSHSKNQFFNSRSLDNYGFEKSTIDPNQSRYSKMERLSLIREKARQLEENVNRKEQLMKVQGGSANQHGDVNDMLIDAITHKLRILEDL